MEALQPTIFGPIQGIQLQTAECEIGGAVHFETMIWIYDGLSTGLAISAISSITWPLPWTLHHTVSACPVM